jgi:hypothetical protein
MTVEMLMVGERAVIAAASDGGPATLSRIPTLRQTPANKIVGLRKSSAVRRPTLAL